MSALPTLADIITRAEAALHDVPADIRSQVLAHLSPSPGGTDIGNTMSTAPAMEAEPVAQFLPCEDGEFNGNLPDVETAAVGQILSFEPGYLRIARDGSGYFCVPDAELVFEDDRQEGPDGPEGSVHWIARMDASEIVALRDFLNIAHPQDAESLRGEVERLTAENAALSAQALRDRKSANDAMSDALMWQFSVADGLHDGQPLLVKVWRQRKAAEAELAGCKIALEQAWASMRERDAQLTALTPQPDAGLEALVSKGDVLKLLGEAWAEDRDQKEIEDAITALRSRPVGEVKVKPLVWSKTEEGLPQKPGLRDYEQIECLIYLPSGDLEISMWNCEHEVWDDAEGDDFRYDPLYPTHWLALSRIRAALTEGEAG